jgi:NTE family protein
VPEDLAADSSGVPTSAIEGDGRNVDSDQLALVLGGGGARGAYQVGLLRFLARRYPRLRFPIVTGISAGAVNAVHIASHRGSFQSAIESLAHLWLSLTPEQVYRVDARSLVGNVLHWSARLLGGGHPHGQRVRGMVDTSPLRQYLERALERDANGALPGIAAKLASGALRALALSATSYTTGQSVTFVQGRDIALWERPQRRSEHANIGVEHVMASAALPLFFPAVRVGNEWYGDGGVRLVAPLSPALHLGATRIITISTRYARTRQEAAQPQLDGYPPPAQILGTLYNAIFLDLIDQDVMRLERLNRLLEKLPEKDRLGMRVCEILVLRPSRDLGRLSRSYEPRLPRSFRFLTRGLGTRETASPDILSLVMFQEDYLRSLVELGESDAEANAERIEAFVEGRARGPGEALAELSAIASAAKLS